MTTTAPIPRPPAVRPALVAQQRQVTEALAHRLTDQRSSQALDTALMELRDAYLAVRVVCPITTDPDAIQARAAQLRLDVAVIHAIAAGASSHQVTAATGGLA